jgi:hypothetical protein
MCVAFFSTTLFEILFVRINIRWAELEVLSKMHTGLHVNFHLFCQILTETGKCWPILLKLPNIMSLKSLQRFSCFFMLTHGRMNGIPDGSKPEHSTKHRTHATCFKLASCLAYCSTVTMEAGCSSELSADFQGLHSIISLNTELVTILWEPQNLQDIFLLFHFSRGLPAYWTKSYEKF